MLRIIAGLSLLLGLLAANGCCVQRCGPGASPGLPGSHDPCLDACGGGDPCGGGRGGLLARLFNKIACRSGCGELYVDEWLNDPPDCCDPCDHCGNWVGPHNSCKGQPRPLHRGNLWGQRHTGAAHSSW